MDMKRIRDYADVIVSVGLDVREGDKVQIRGDVETTALLREIVRLCWRKGAADVAVEFRDREMEAAKYEEARSEVFDAFPTEKKDYAESLLKARYHEISVGAPSLDRFSHIETDRLARWNRTVSSAMEPLMAYMDKGDIKWVVAAAPSEAWAKKLFPGLPAEEGMDAFWDLIFKMCRLDEEDPVAAWKAHDHRLRAYGRWLDEQRFERLHYEGPGTDLVVYLADRHTWVGGSSDTPDGVSYMANIPTEEIFTTPHCMKVDGVVRATKPLYDMGKLIEDFSLTFENGRVVDFFCEKNGDVLKDILDLDEGARRLGEVAIVPDSTPIAQSGVLFYSTLFDENASCHFALGNSYAETMTGGPDMTREERMKHGGNYSMTHVDFMVGGPHLNITGYRADGTAVPVLRGGEWAFSL